jgi:hypothetical protein
LVAGADDGMRINELIRKSVIFLGVIDRTGAFVPYGTGFVVMWSQEAIDVAFSYLVTAKHVLDDMQASGCPIAARFNTKQGNAAIGRINAIQDWFYHPTDKKCDVAISHFNAANELIDYRGVLLNDAPADAPSGKKGGALTDAYIAENDVGCGDEVYTAGLLVRHFGASRNIPVVRTGNIAAMPEEPVDLGNKLGHQSVYLIESRSIGGLSGSPVFLHTTPYRVTQEGDIKAKHGHQTEYLIGVNIGLFETGAHSDKLPSDTETRREHFLETMSAGIAIVVPIQRVIEIITDTPALAAGRAMALKTRDARAGFVPSSGKPTITGIESAPLTDEEIVERHDAALAKMLSTPPQNK